MRALLALAAAAALLAGCAATQDNRTSTATTATDSVGNQGIAAGEPNPSGGGMQGGMLIRPDHEENTSAGLDLVGDESASGLAAGGQVTFTFNATNVGAAAKVQDVCLTPWTYTLRDANGTERQMAEPKTHCMAIAYADFPAGASLQDTLAWNGTLWNADGAYAGAAPAGHYTLTASFTAQRDGTPAVVTVTLGVNVLGNRGAL